MDDGIKDVIIRAWEKNVIVAKQFICEPGKSESHVCKKCLEYSNHVFSWPQNAGAMPEVPVHPHCYCHYRDLTAMDVRNLALAEKRKILEIAAVEDKVQSQKQYSIFTACGTQADELACRLYEEHFGFWYFRILHGSMTPFSEEFAQHHVVSVHPIAVNPYEAFILDTWNRITRDISGETTVAAWQEKWFCYYHHEEKSTAELIDEMNHNATGKKRGRP